MLVTGLKDLYLFKMVSGDDENCSSVHSLLCECAREMLAKYEQEQAPGTKIRIKTEAAENLLIALCKAPKGQRETHETILSALKSHAEALQGYEHLLSEKGSTYALVEQTQALRDSHDYASVSLLRYHQLKNKFLGPGTPLNDEQKKVLSELDKKKDLTLKMLEAIDKDFPPDSRVSEASCLSGTPGDLVNMPEIIRIDIINTMKKMGYHPDDEGMCYGIAWTALLACVRQDGQAYMKRMQYLKQMYIPPLRRADEYQVYPFFDAVTLSQINYENMSGYSKGIGYPGRQEVAFPGSIIAGHRPGYEVVPVVKHAFITECTLKTFIKFLLQTRKNNKGIPFGVMINYPDHTISIGFDGSKWLAVDHSYHYYIATTELLFLFLYKRSHRHKNGRIIAEIEVIASKGHSITVNKGTLVVNSKKSVSVPMTLQLALQCGDVNVMNDCITVIGQQAHAPETLLEQLTCKGARGEPGFFMACQNGHSEAIATFIKKTAAIIVKLSLSKSKKTKWLYKLFASRRTDDTSGLCMALSNGHIEAITAFIQECAAIIATLPLPKEQKAELMYGLLACKMGDGVPGFYLPFQEDQPEVITAFIQASVVAAAILSDSEEEKAELLYSFFCRIENEDNLLFLQLMDQAGPAVQKAFIEGIDQLPLSTEQKEALKYPACDFAENKDIP